MDSHSATMCRFSMVRRTLDGNNASSFGLCGFQ